MYNFSIYFDTGQTHIRSMLVLLILKKSFALDLSVSNSQVLKKGLMSASSSLASVSIYSIVSLLQQKNMKHTENEQISDISTLSPPRTIVRPYANSLYPDERPSNSASHPDPSCLTLRQHVQQL